MRSAAELKKILNFKDMNILDRKLEPEEIHEIVQHLFGFSYVGDSEGDEDGQIRPVLYDDEGLEFYGMNCNHNFYLGSLRGIFEYLAHQNRLMGENNIKSAFKRLLGV